MLEYLVVKRKEAQRLARLTGSQEAKQKPPHKKGNVHAAIGDPGGGGGRGGKGWECSTTGCTYKGRHFLSECRAFKRMSVDERGKIILKKSLCVLCFGSHKVDDCPKRSSGWKVCDVSNCGRWHSRLLHGASVPGLVLLSKGNNAERSKEIRLHQCSRFLFPFCLVAYVEESTG